MRLLILVAFFMIIGTACGGSGGSLEANAGEDFSIQIGEQPRFDGCESTGTIVNYKWTIVSAPDKMSEDAGKIIREMEPECAFTLDAQMGVDEVGVWEIQLEVTDEEGNKELDGVTVTVTG